jgi:CRISPR/Cas system-associated endonuclease Cas3-HD
MSSMSSSDPILIKLDKLKSVYLKLVGNDKNGKKQVENAIKILIDVYNNKKNPNTATRTKREVLQFFKTKKNKTPL